ncbi:MULTISPECIES: MarR family winged helix-turn-helix transcriptional regulator [Amycolatopsis]|uniref:DNA-binding transcriptional regulator, MarR family n=2 Tax=Amycolatopsis TaxID=1813 RepID=A0A1I3TWG5_9PSEU|nr:MarR family transcriptional regulator [Amycolatopsis sacchari]SFJ75010.1 DNA-binding transcriptional regulator, MarR family [Amycolatopsis sacchari]
MSSEREELVARLIDASRALSTETVMFHTAIAERQGLSAVETKAMDYLARFGPLTPKQLSERSGLAPASVTALIDRLERKGTVKRTPHPRDRRRLLVELNPEYARSIAPLWDHLIQQVRELCATYSDEQLALVADFTVEAARITHEAAARLTDR